MGRHRGVVRPGENVVPTRVETEAPHIVAVGEAPRRALHLERFRVVVQPDGLVRAAGRQEGLGGVEDEVVDGQRVVVEGADHRAD